MKKPRGAKQIAQLFKSLSQPARVEILLAIGAGEACVCHLEAALKLRQAYISQHLMALRQEGILEARREGRFVYYRLAREELLILIRQAAAAVGAAQEAEGKPRVEGCPCPHCSQAGEATIIPAEAVSSLAPAMEGKS